jgi:hypothetical protein
VELERRGIPAVAFGTTAFENLARFQAKSYGMPDLALVLIDHPLGGIPLPDAVAKAEGAVAEVAAAVQARLAIGAATPASMSR